MIGNVAKENAEMTRLLVLYHSVTGHVAALAEAVAAGAAEIDGCDVTVQRIPETVDAAALYGNTADTKGPRPTDPAADPATLADYDGFAFGFPVHFAAPSAAVTAFLAGTGKDWMSGAMAGKPATVFVAGGSGGGRETAILGLWSALASHGMTLVPLGNRTPAATDLTTPNGCSPLGAGTLSGAAGDRPSDAEREAARIQGRAWAETAVAVSGNV